VPYQPSRLLTSNNKLLALAGFAGSDKHGCLCKVVVGGVDVWAVISIALRISTGKQCRSGDALLPVSVRGNLGMPTVPPCKHKQDTSAAMASNFNAQEAAD
jgi:hypothetical protein